MLLLGKNCPMVILKGPNIFIFSRHSFGLDNQTAAGS
jgi:hypothetical protein